MILNPYRFASGGGGGGSQSFNSALLSAPAVLTNSDLRLTANTGATGDYANARAIRAVTGDCYFSATVANNTTEDAGFGVARESFGITSAVDFVREPGMYSTNGNTYGPGGLIASGGTLGSVSSVEVAIRTSTRRVWIRRNGGAWVGGGDPVADTSPTLTLSGTDLIFPAATLTRAGASGSRYVQLHPDAASTTGTVPSGFTAANWAS